MVPAYASISASLKWRLNVPKHRENRRRKKVSETGLPIEDCTGSVPAEPAATAEALLRQAEAVRKAQLDLTFKRLRGLSQEQRDGLDAMTKALVEDLLHDPLRHVRGCNNGDEDYAETVRRLFHLDIESDEPGARDA